MSTPLFAGSAPLTGGGNREGARYIAGILTLCCANLSERILVTGSSGLIGRALVDTLRSRGHHVEGLDARDEGSWFGDVRDPDRVARAVEGCSGVVHLAAMSRVAWGEDEPDLCRAINVGGVRNVLDAVEDSARAPWIIFASSREVYGHGTAGVTAEDAPFEPLNVYAHTKVAGERMVQEAASAGVRAGIVRLSNVYGDVDDHPDRVIPAFVRRALLGEPLHVQGPSHGFDFTYLDDTIDGIIRVVDRLRAGDTWIDPIHFVTGRTTSLLELAEAVLEVTGSASSLEILDPRPFDVLRFSGSAERAQRELGWSARVPLMDGIRQYAVAFDIALTEGWQPTEQRVASGAFRAHSALEDVP